MNALISPSEAMQTANPLMEASPEGKPGKNLRLIILLLLIALLLAGLLLPKFFGKGRPAESLPGIATITGFTPENDKLFFQDDDPRLIFNGKRLKPGDQKIFIANLTSQGEEGTNLNLPAPGSGYAFVYFPSRGWLASFSNDTAAYLSKENPGSVISVLSDRRGRALRFEGLEERSGESSFTYVAEPVTPQVPPRKTSIGGPAG
jgi:hypothetical protein